MTVAMLDPTADDVRMETRMAPRDGTLQGKRVGLLANGKTNADRLLEVVGELLVERYGLAAPLLIDKRNATAPASDEVLERLLPHCDVVVTAIGD
ncbi:MAG: hypothetical protein AB7R89_26075 [Dehalococcoidia bacterium]